MVPQGGIEYMAGGTGSHRKIKQASLGRQKKKQEQEQHQKQKRWGRGKAKATPKPHPSAEVCLTTPISLYKGTEDHRGKRRPINVHLFDALH